MLFALYDPVSSSWRTCQACFDWDSPMSSQTWPRSGMWAAGECWQLPMWALPTSATASSSSPWPTPDAGAFNASEDPASWLARAGRLSAKWNNGLGAGIPLGVAVRLDPQWPTPTAQDSASSGAAGYSTESGRHSGTTLTDAAVRQWPTPLAQAFDLEEGFRKDGTNLHLLGAVREEQAVSAVIGRNTASLNPAWVEGLMGFPPGWTEVPGWKPPRSRSTAGRRAGARRSTPTSPRVSPGGS